MRYWLARDSGLLGRAERVFIEEVFRDLRARAGVRRMRDGLCGAVTAVQRFGGALNLNVHFHTLVLDGVYRADLPKGALGFRRLRAPSREDLLRVVERVRRRVYRLLAAKGCPVGSDGVEDGAEAPSLFDVVQAASIRERIGLADEPRRVPMVGGVAGEEAPSLEPELCVSVDGFSVHAAVRVRAGDRRGLEKVCRYVLRPAFAGERLERLPDGRIAYGMRRPRADGSTHVVLTPMEFMEKLAALACPP